MLVSFALSISSAMLSLASTSSSARNPARNPARNSRISNKVADGFDGGGGVVAPPLSAVWTLFVVMVVMVF